MSKDHERAKTLLNKAKLFKEKKDLALRALNEARLEDAENIYTEAIGIDPRNKGTNANLLADRAEVSGDAIVTDYDINNCLAGVFPDEKNPRLCEGL